MVAIADRHDAAGQVALLIASAVNVRGLYQVEHAALHFVGLRGAEMAEGAVLLQDGIQVLSNRSDLRDCCVRAAPIGARSWNADSSRGLAACHTLPIGNRTSLGSSAGHARQGAARLRSLQVPLRDERIVAAYFDVDVVFERERNGVLRGEVQHAGADQRSDAFGIGESDRGNGYCQIGPDDDGSLLADWRNVLSPGERRETQRGNDAFEGGHGWTPAGLVPGRSGGSVESRAIRPRMASSREMLFISSVVPSA